MKTNEALEELRKKLAKTFGVTLQVDTCGNWGDLGATYVTVRWSKHGLRELIQVQMKVLNVTGVDEEIIEDTYDRIPR